MNRHNRLAILRILFFLPFRESIPFLPEACFVHLDLERTARSGPRVWPRIVILPRRIALAPGLIKCHPSFNDHSLSAIKSDTIST